MRDERATGRYPFEYWKDPESDDEADDWKSTDFYDLLECEAERILSFGIFKCAILYQWNYATEEWDERKRLPEL
jgi:hypothetical protein